ncbi:hypothetical protein NMY22_g6699 [Coprinellus aureogranulatus]|nr:hypothetical protein NMY22_g6699 [Coprinellus aureogranulatus]
MASSIRLGSSSPRQTQLEVLDYILNSMSAEAFVSRLRVSLDPSMGAFRLVEQDWQAQEPRDTVGNLVVDLDDDLTYVLGCRTPPFVDDDSEFSERCLTSSSTLASSTSTSPWYTPPSSPTTLIPPPPPQAQPSACSASRSPVSVAPPHPMSGLPPTAIPHQSASLSRTTLVPRRYAPLPLRARGPARYPAPALAQTYAVSKARSPVAGIQSGSHS